MNCSPFLSKSEIAVSEYGYFLPVLVDASDIKVFCANHEVDVGKGFVDAKSMDFLFRVFFKIRIEAREAFS